MNKLILLLLLPLNIVAQEFINSNSFDTKIAKGITVVEFCSIFKRIKRL